MKKMNLEALIDTGAEINLINPNVAHKAVFKGSMKPVRLGSANSHQLQGGENETRMVIEIKATEMDTGRMVQVQLPCMAYDGEITCDLILSYGWIAEHQINVNPRRNGLNLPLTYHCHKDYGSNASS